MQIAKVEIHNFRGIRDLAVNPSRYHVLIGENGGGKTAVLEAIRLATSSRVSPASISEQDFNSHDEGDISVVVEFDHYFLATVEDGYAIHKVPCHGVSLEVKRRKSGTRGKVLSDPFVVAQRCLPVPYTSVTELDAARMPRGQAVNQLPPAVAVSADLIKITRKGGGSTRDLRLGALNLSQDLIGYPSVFLFDRQREREARHGFGTLLTRIARELNWRYRKKWDEVATEDTWGRYYDLTVGVVQDRKGKRVLEPLRQRLSALLKRDYGALELSLLAVEEPFSNSFLALRSGLNQVSLERFGSGEAVIVAYALLEHMSRLSGDDVIFLIDEPEMHLHPQVQRRLVDDFRASPHQIIVSSHAPLFASFALWRGITRMHRGAQYPEEAVLAATECGRSIAEHLDEIQAWQQEKTLFADDDAELLFAPLALLVEGPVDRHGLQLLAARVGYDWGEVSVIQGHGKQKLPYYALIARAFGIPAFGVFDLDGKASTASENANVQNRLFGATCATFAQSFEEAIGCHRNSSHKASRALEIIDSMPAADIPGDVLRVLQEIETWRATHTGT